MITELRNGGRTDGDLCCPGPHCGRRGLWQPADRSPCGDDWWCRHCREWVEPVMCGPYPLRYHRRDAAGQSTLVPACR